MNSPADRLIAELVNRHLDRATQNITNSIDDVLAAMRPEIESLVQQVVTDPLTQVLNRNALLNDQTSSLLRDLINKRQGSIAMFDLDHFKQVNDKHGHPVGDLALIYVTNIAKQTFNVEHDSIYRYGGEEFVIISSDPDPEAFKQRLKEFHGRLNDEKLETSSDVLKITSSIGVIESRILGSFIQESDSYTDQELVARTLELPDVALYVAKDNGRNQVVEHCGTETKVIQGASHDVDKGLSLD